MQHNKIEILMMTRKLQCLTQFFVLDSIIIAGRERLNECVFETRSYYMVEKTRRRDALIAGT